MRSTRDAPPPIRGLAPFALALVRDLVAATPGGNVFAAPASAYAALLMTAAGAAGDTRAEMLTTLGLTGASDEAIDAAVAALARHLTVRGAGVEIANASSLWLRPGIEYAPAFIASCRARFDAKLGSLAVGPAGINAWVSEHTGGRIRDLVDESAPLAVLLLVNAIWFKGSWSTPFSPEATRTADFHLADGTRLPVAMMRREGAIRYCAQPELSAIRLAYGAGDLDMTVVLPAPGKTPADVLASLDPDGWSRLVQGLVPTELELALPRFRLEYASDLRDALRAIGMPRAFDPAGAEFQPMFEQTLDSEVNVYVSRVLHNTFLDVDEAGTEAAAATAIEMMMTGTADEPGFAFPFVVDRPFVVAIGDRRSATPLFLGVVERPTAASAG